jgi:hypothetical protein
MQRLFRGVVVVVMPLRAPAAPWTVKPMRSMVTFEALMEMPCLAATPVILPVR